MTQTHDYVACEDCALDPLCHPDFLARGAFSNILDYVQRRKQISANSTVYTPGEPVNYLYAVTSGAFKLIIEGSRTEPQVCGFRFKGELLGDESLTTPHYKVTAIALSDASVCAIPVQLISELSESMPRFQKAFLTLIIQQCSLAHQQIADYVALKTAEQKLAAFLLHLSQRNTLINHSQNDLYLAMARTDISNYLGLRHETLSRTLSRLQANHLISVNRRQVLIKHREALQALANGQITFNSN